MTRTRMSNGALMLGMLTALAPDMDLLDSFLSMDHRPWNRGKHRQEAIAWAQGRVNFHERFMARQHVLRVFRLTKNARINYTFSVDLASGSDHTALGTFNSSLELLKAEVYKACAIPPEMMVRIFNGH